MRKKMLIGLVVVLVIGGGVVAWLFLSKPALPPGFAGANGRLEANQLFVATKRPGRIREVLANEGDTVEAGQVIARMDTLALEAQLRAAEAQIVEAQESQKVALAQVEVKKADYNYSNKQYLRSKALVKRSAVSEQEAEIDFAHAAMTKAEVVGAEAQVSRTQSTIAAAVAEAERLKVEIKDSELVSPIRARVESRLAEPGEVLSIGGRVYSLLDLSDVYMYVFLPEAVTGKVALGSEARIVLDAAPQYPIKAVVSYVSPMAQFTPKTVETAEERHLLSFRVKLQIDKARLREFEPLVKTGIPGVGYVRFDSQAVWPANLQSNPVSPQKLWKPTGAVAAKSTDAAVAK